MALIRGHDLHLLSFDDVVDKLRLKQTVYKGVFDVPLDQIVGSAGRYEDFTRHFFPRLSHAPHKERWRNIYTLAVTGKGFPPIDLYKIDRVYFVKDGNHRVSVARELGWASIQAHVTELPTSISLTPDVQPDDLLLKSECAYFLEQTELDQTRPDSKEHIGFTLPGGYLRLLRHIELRRLWLQSQDDGHVVTLVEAAIDWYDNVYRPLITALAASDILRLFPSRNESDLYVWLIKHQVKLREAHDLDQLQLSPDLTEFLESVRTIAESESAS